MQYTHIDPEDPRLDSARAAFMANADAIAALRTADAEVARLHRATEFDVTATLAARKTRTDAHEAKMNAEADFRAAKRDTERALDAQIDWSPIMNTWARHWHARTTD